MYDNVICKYLCIYFHYNYYYHHHGLPLSCLVCVCVSVNLWRHFSFVVLNINSSTVTTVFS